MNLEVKNINFGFTKAKKVLNNISFSSKEAKIIAIVGASGCGKSTFLRLLCGLVQGNATNIFEGSIKIQNETPTEFTKAGKTGFMFQEPTLFPNLTVKENIALPLKFIKANNQNKTSENNTSKIAEIDNLIEMVGLKEFADYLPAQLSGGMKTRVALARTFVTKPQLLLLDEPFGALDIRWKFLLYRELEVLRESYSPMVVIVTHDIQEALLLSNHILVFGKEGKILKEILINKPLPRVFETDAIKDLQNEYLEIQNLIMNDAPLIDNSISGIKK